MFCNECGAKNPDTAKFCCECGAKINMTITPSTDTESTEKKAVSKTNNDIGEKQEEKKMTETPIAKTEPVVKPAPTTPTEATPVVKAEAKETISIEEKLANLSTAGMSFETKVASKDVDPIQDPYWDDVLPEIDNEIYAIPKDNIIKVAASIVALFAVIAWLIYML